MDNTHEVLLKVENLCQYFKMGGGQELKAVDGVSFEIHKGEVFGLVGESGCGKTTTGRSIIRLYDITSGNVWFKGQRVRSYKEAIRAAYAAYRKAVREVTAEAEKAVPAIPSTSGMTAKTPIRDLRESLRRSSRLWDSME